MKKLSFILTLAAILLAAPSALANSAPITDYYTQFTPEGPHYMLGVLEDCEIGVEKEDLGFDIHFVMGNVSYMDVSAAYEMKNYGEAQSVTMAFPILFSLKDMDAFMDANVKAGGVQVNASHLFVSSLYNLANMGTREHESREKKTDSEIEEYAKNLCIEDLLAYCNHRVVYRPFTYSPDDPLDVYALQCSTEANDLEIIIGDQGYGEVAAFGASENAVYRQETGYLVEIHMDEPQQETFIAVPAGSDMSEIEAYELKDPNTRYETRTPLPSDGIQLIRRKSMTMEGLIRDVFMKEVQERCPDIGELCSEDELYSQIAAIFDYEFVRDIVDIVNQLQRLKVAGLLVYEVPFEAGQTKPVEVTYRQRPDYFGDQTAHAEYTYITSPAQHYRNFGTLNVKIGFSNRPFFTSCNAFSKMLHFTEAGHSKYTATRQGLPTRPLTFSIACEVHYFEYVIYTIIIVPIIIITILLICLVHRLVVKRELARDMARSNLWNR